MCGPAAIPLVVSMVATVAQGYMAKQQAKGQAKYEEGVAQYNARSQENEATKVANKGVEAENEHRRQVAEMQAEQKAQFGASGIDPLTGSAALIQADTALLGEADALRIRSNYGEKAESLREQAGLTRYEGEAKADVLRSKGRSAFTGSLLSAAGTVAGSGVADKWFSSTSAARSPTALARTNTMPAGGIPYRY